MPICRACWETSLVEKYPRFQPIQFSFFPSPALSFYVATKERLQKKIVSWTRVWPKKRAKRDTTKKTQLYWSSSLKLINRDADQRSGQLMGKEFYNVLLSLSSSQSVHHRPWWEWLSHNCTVGTEPSWQVLFYPNPSPILFNCQIQLWAVCWCTSDGWQLCT